MPAAQAAVPGVSELVSTQAEKYRRQFLDAKPFKHVAIEDFFEPEFAERLLHEFPSFESGFSINEHGEPGNKSVNTKIREISPAYRQLYELIGSKPFLELVSRLSGIPDLVMDPKMYGGGTHENRHGQELDAHVDFNYDEAEKLHRRLNLIVYLNKEWKTEWGGAIEIHSDPWRPEKNEIRAFDPTFNRCVMFETNEYSWHGFPRINLPPDKRHLSRKSISIYLYTKERPAHEIAPMHGTFYVQRPLPPHIQPGYTLTPEDVKEIRNLLDRRDGWLRSYQQMELNKNREIAQLKQRILHLEGHIALPLSGFALQTPPVAGLYPDQWASPHVAFGLFPLAPVTALLLRGSRPENAPPARIRFVAGQDDVQATIGGGEFKILLKLSKPLDKPFGVDIDTYADAPAVDPASDQRPLAFHIDEIRVKHPVARAIAKNFS
jgi:hypothetical protein